MKTLMTTVVVTTAMAACAQEQTENDSATYRLLAIHDEHYVGTPSTNDCYYDYEGGMPPDFVCEGEGAFASYTVSRSGAVVAYDAGSSIGEVTVDGDRVVSVARHDAGSDRTHVFTYDDGGRVVGWSSTLDFGDGFPSDSTTTLTYEGERLVAMTSPNSATVLTYDASGLLVRSHYTLLVGQQPTTTIDFAYDDARRLSGATITQSEDTTVFSYAFTYDEASGLLGRYEFSVDGELWNRTHLTYERGETPDFTPTVPMSNGALFDLDGRQLVSPQLMTDEWFRGTKVLLNLL